jgi:phosphoglycolate phosphatase-like HAD superfamily hydrolase
MPRSEGSSPSPGTRGRRLSAETDPAAFNAIIERHGLVRDETMAIGDRDIDVLAGRSAGLYPCFFGPENTDVDADLRIGDFGELARLLAAPD